MTKLSAATTGIGGNGDHESLMATNENAIPIARADAAEMCMCVFSGEFDRLLAALTIATATAASGASVSMFFTFWGTAALKSDEAQSHGKTFVEKLFGWMLRGGFSRLRLSRLEMAGIGRWLMRREMRRKGHSDIERLLTLAAELDVRIYVCSASMELMGIRAEELVNYPGLAICGATRFSELALTADSSLFI